jgi:hypothetical protein
VDAIKVEIDKVPRDGESYKWTNLDTDVYANVSIGAAD